MSASRKLPWLDDIMYGHDYWWHIDHFNYYVTADFWTTIATDSGTVAGGDAANGVITLTPSDGTVADNDEVYVKSTHELFLFADTRIIYGGFKVKFSQGNTNQNQTMFGFMNAVAANSIVDDAGPKTNFSGMVFHSNAGSLVWNVTTSDGATQTTTATGSTAGGSAWQLLEIVGECRGTRLTARYRLDGVVVKDASGYDIVHETTFANATEMNAVMACKQGSATAETCQVDFAKLAQSIV